MSLTDNQIVAKNFKKYHEAILPYLNGSAHSGFTPIGTVISVMGTTAPLNYLACDGTVYNIADYTELAAYFNQQFGSSNFFGGNGTTTFAVPDLRGEFLRGTGTNSHANQGSGAAVGVHQDGTEIPSMEKYSGNPGLMYSSSASKNLANPDYVENTTGFKYAGTGGTSNTSEPNIPNYYTSRPTNTSVLYCIASKNIFMDAGSNYSTEEQVVGTWIDGKPIYQKTFIIDKTTMASIPINYSTYNVVTSLVDIKQIISLQSYLRQYYTNLLEGVYDATYFIDNTLKLKTWFRNFDKIGFAWEGWNPSAKDFELSITIQYTKTTD